jgi:hypothetical protein
VSDIAQRIKDLLPLDEKRTPGKWIAAGPSFGDPKPRWLDSVHVDDGTDDAEQICEITNAEFNDVQDADFIAAAPDAFSLLREALAEIERLNTRVSAMSAALAIRAAGGL